MTGKKCEIEKVKSWIKGCGLENKILTICKNQFKKNEKKLNKKIKTKKYRNKTKKEKWKTKK